MCNMDKKKGTKNHKRELIVENDTLYFLYRNNTLNEMILYILQFYFLIYLSCLWSLVFLICQKETHTHTQTRISPSNTRCTKTAYQKYKVTLQETPTQLERNKILTIKI